MPAGVLLASERLTTDEVRRNISGVEAEASARQGSEVRTKGVRVVLPCSRA